ncbi:unnamed protein product [Blepharisma stoltei]|uniref:Uncharacterized protein n=1 Tax=Blepharisma stoltei TaxID=1481888 RepID=A0AAU9IQJ3_9CILI|nr:unnamed protein product [Blepharisma stoltei]
MEERISCFYENCKENPEFSCNCNSIETILCNQHMGIHLSNPVAHKVEALFEKPNPQSKEAVLELLKSEKNALEESLKNALKTISESSKQTEMNFEETLKNFDPNLSKVEALINLVSNTEKISKYEKDILIKSLALSQQEAIQLYKNLIPQASNLDNAIKFFCTFDVEKLISQLVENKIKFMINKRTNPIENRLNKFDNKISLLEKNCEKKINEAMLKYDRKIEEIGNYGLYDRFAVENDIKSSKEKIELLNSEHMKLKKSLEAQLKEAEAKHLSMQDVKLKALKDEFLAELKNALPNQIKELEMRYSTVIDTKINDLKDKFSAELKNINQGFGPQVKLNPISVSNLTPNRKIELECEELDNFDKKISNILNCESIKESIANIPVEMVKSSKVSLEKSNKQVLQDYNQTNINYGSNADYIQLFEYSSEIKSKYKIYYKNFRSYSEKYRRTLLCLNHYHQEVSKFKNMGDKIKSFEGKIDRINQTYFELSQETFINLSKELENLNAIIEEDFNYVNEQYNKNQDFKDLIQDSPELQKHFNEYLKVKKKASEAFNAFTLSSVSKINEEINNLKSRINICSQFKSQIEAQMISCSTILFSSDIPGIKIIYESITKEYNEIKNIYENNKTIKDLCDVCAKLKEVYQDYAKEYLNVAAAYNRMVSIPESSKFLYAVTNCSVREKDNRGYYNSIKKTLFTKIDILNTTKNSWYINTPEPLSINACIALLPDNELFCYGSKNPFSGISCIISTKNCELGRMLPPGTPCYDSGAIYLNNSVYVFGGKDQSDNRSQLVTCFNLIQNSWSRLSPLPIASGSCSCIYFNQKILLTGYYHSKIYKYNIQSNNYSEVLSFNISSNRTKLLFQSKNKAYLIQSGDIYESGVSNENTWKKIGYSNLNSFAQLCIASIYDDPYIGFFHPDYGYCSGNIYKYYKFNFSKNTLENCQEFRF